MDLTREQLYDMLWTDGVGKTQEALGLKPEEMKKLCEDFQIPKPSSKYWIALAYDKAPEKTPLPEVEDNRPIKTEDYVKPCRAKKVKPTPKPEPEPPKKNAEGKYEPRELPEEAPSTIYTVPDTLYAKDPILLDTKQKLREKNSLSRRDNPWSTKNPYKSSPKKWLSIDVSEAQEDRALRIFATIWKAAEARGYHLRIDVDKGPYHTTCTTFFIVRNYKIRVELKEINKRVKEDEHSWTTLVGSGRLKFICDRGGHRFSFERDRIAAQDTERTKLEDMIERIVDVFGEIADERDQAEVERKLAEERRKREEELQRQEEERKRLEAEEQARLEALRDEERGRVTELLFEAERVKTAAMIREYASEYEAAMAEKLPPEEMQAKLKWMRDKADFIDPFVQREDELLQPKDIGRLLSPEIIKTTEERRSTSYGYGSSHDTTYSYWQIKNMWKRR